MWKKVDSFTLLKYLNKKVSNLGKKFCNCKFQINFKLKKGNYL